MRALNTAARWQAIVAFSFIFWTRVMAAADDPNACPTSAEAQSQYSVTPVSVSDNVKTLMTEADKALRQGGVRANALPASSALTPASVAQGLLDAAKQELGAYFASVALKEICGSPRVSPYFPNTCALNTGGALQTGTDIQFNSLASSIRADVRGLPSCLVRRRTRSPVGYLVYSIYEGLQTDTDAELPAYIHALAIHKALAGACESSGTATEDVAPTAGVTKPLAVACKAYYLVVAVDAMYIVRNSLVRDGSWKQQITRCQTDFTTCKTLIEKFEQAFVADLYLRQSKVSSPKDDLSGDSLVSQWIAFLKPHYTDLSWPITARMAVAVGTIGNFVDSAEKAFSDLRTLQKQLPKPPAADNTVATDKGSAAARESKQLAIDQQVATLGTDLANLLASGSGILQLSDVSRSDAKLRSSVDSKLPLTRCQVVAGGTPPTATQNVTDAYCLGDNTAELVRILALAVSGYSYYRADNYAAAVENAVEIVQCATKSTGCLPDGAGAALPSGNTLAFIVAVAGAKDAQSFNDVLKSTAAPLDAWKAKTAASMWWVGSLVGAQVGKERNTGHGQTFTGYEYGMFAPIGMGISTPWRNHPAGIFVSVVDVGALITVSHGNASVNTAAQSGWSQTLSPGLYGFYEPFGPIVFGLGYAYKTPALRTTTASNGTLVSLDSSRFMLFAAVDVTLLRLR